MDKKDLKKVFGEIAIASGFNGAFGGWYKESSECIAVTELQKSNFGNYYLLNLKVFIQGTFGRTYTPNKDLIKSSLGDINTNETEEYSSALDIEKSIDDGLRKQRLEELFVNHIIPFTNKVSTRQGIKELAAKGEIFLLPAVKEELEKLPA